MRLVQWTDKEGLNHLSWVQDNQSDRDAPKGLPADPPTLFLDWELIRKELHNELVDRKLIDWAAVQTQENAITTSVIKVIKRKLLLLYRQGVTNG